MLNSWASLLHYGVESIFRETFPTKIGPPKGPRDVHCEWCGKSDPHPSGSRYVRVLLEVSFCSRCLPSAVLAIANKNLTMKVGDHQWGELPRSR